MRPLQKGLPNLITCPSFLPFRRGVLAGNSLRAVRLVVPRNPTTTYGGKSRFRNHMTWRDREPIFFSVRAPNRGKYLVAIRNCCPLCACVRACVVRVAGCIWHPIRIFGATHRPRPTATDRGLGGNEIESCTEQIGPLPPHLARPRPRPVGRSSPRSANSSPMYFTATVARLRASKRDRGRRTERGERGRVGMGWADELDGMALN